MLIDFSVFIIFYFILFYFIYLLLFFNREALLDPERGYKGNRVDGLDFYIEHMTWKRLPKDVFKPLGGFDAAKVLRQERGYGVKKPKEENHSTSNEEGMFMMT